MRCLNPLAHAPHEFLADSEAITYSNCSGAGGIDPNCPHDDGPFHFWQPDGSPFGVVCDNCGAEGHVTVVEEGSA